jgi:hypothetical protein
VGVDVEALQPVHGHQRRLDQLLVHLVREVVFERAAIQVELAGAGHQAHPHHGLLAAADGLDRAVDHDGLPRSRFGLDHGFGRIVGLLNGLSHWATCLISYGTGFWAVCGWSGPA